MGAMKIGTVGRGRAGVGSPCYPSPSQPISRRTRQPLQLRPVSVGHSVGLTDMDGEEARLA